MFLLASSCLFILPSVCILHGTSGVPRNFFRGGGVRQEFFSGGSTNSVEHRGLRERRSGGASPLVRGFTQFANDRNFGGVEPPNHPSVRLCMEQSNFHKTGFIYCGIFTKIRKVGIWLKSDYKSLHTKSYVIYDIPLQLVFISEREMFSMKYQLRLMKNLVV
jgi:hypothetical protein